VLGIEAVGVVARCPGGEFPVGQQVAAMMGGMGRVFDDLPPRVLQAFLDAAASGDAVIPIDHVYRLDEIVEAHTAMEAGTAAGKLVVTT
jgi:NADPH:quinone reductase